MLGFDGVYVASDLQRTLETIVSALSKGRTAALTFRPSGYKTTAECRAEGTKIAVELSVNWARGYARRELTAEQITDLTAELARYGSTVWVHIEPHRPITLMQPT